MTLNPSEQSVRDRIHGVADSLPVETAAAWQKVQTRVALRTAQPRLAETTARPNLALRARRRLPMLAAGSAATVAAITAGVLTFATGPAAGAPALPEPLPFIQGGHAAAVALLESAADLQDRVPGDSAPVTYAQTQNYSLQTNVADDNSTNTVETTIRDVWLTASGTGLAKTALQDTTRAGSPIGQPQRQTTDQWHDSNANLPTAPSALRTALLGADGSNEDANLILPQQIMSDLAQGTTTSAQTASLYRLLAQSPGVFDAGSVTDPAGREGHAVGIVTGHFDAGRSCRAVTTPSSSMTATLAANHVLGDGTTYLLLNPTTGQPLMVESLDTPNPPCALGLPAGTTIEQYNLILTTARVSGIGASVRKG